MQPADLGAAVGNHNWMALFALEAGNVDEARHHVDHIIELVDGDHLSRMKKIAESLFGEDDHEAIHASQKMLVRTVAIDLAENTMHLRLALSAVRVDNVAEATHHVEHFVPLAPGTEVAEEIIVLLRDGKLYPRQSTSWSRFWVASRMRYTKLTSTRKTIRSRRCLAAQRASGEAEVGHNLAIP